MCISYSESLVKKQRPFPFRNFSAGVFFAHTHVMYCSKITGIFWIKYFSRRHLEVMTKLIFAEIGSSQLLNGSQCFGEIDITKWKKVLTYFTFKTNVIGRDVQVAPHVSFVERAPQSAMQAPI